VAWAGWPGLSLILIKERKETMLIGLLMYMIGVGTGIGVAAIIIMGPDIMARRNK
jgi:hypothetical protein